MQGSKRLYSLSMNAEKNVAYRSHINHTSRSSRVYAIGGASDPGVADRVINGRQLLGLTPRTVLQQTPSQRLR